MSEQMITLYSLLGAVIVVLLYGACIFFSRRRKNIKTKVKLKERIGNKPSPTKKEAAISLIKQESETERFLESKVPRIEGFNEWIQHSGLKISPLILVLLGIALGGSFIFSFIFIFKLKVLFSIVFGMFLAFFLPWLIIKIAIVRTRNKFLQDFPSALDMMYRSLRAGHSVDRAMEMVAEHKTNIVGNAFHTINEKIRLGEPPEIALGEMANRLGIEEFRMLAIVIVLQRETGGGLANAINNFSQIIKARENLRKKKKALSGEVRLTAIIITCIPIVILGVTYIINPQYLDPMFDRIEGQRLFMVAAGMLGSGVTIVFRMAYKDVY